jgi:hypothetical protein
VSRFDALFAYVAKAILGRDAECSLKLTGNGLQAKLSGEGVAMDSLTAIVFDLAAMLMAVEGLARLPALFIHDSPREADLGRLLYHKLFRLVAKLEELGTVPPFQYVVTTTTEPPLELQTPKFLVARLVGEGDERRFLRRSV